jgi:hypothetical protein
VKNSFEQQKFCEKIGIGGLWGDDGGGGFVYHILGLFIFTAKGGIK